MSHTPAPWGFEVIDSTDIRICTTDKDGNWLHLADIDDLSGFEVNTPDADTRMANARLIAAAPEVLAALEQVVAQFAIYYRRGEGHPLVLSEHNHPFIKEAIDLIAKVKGGNDCQTCVHANQGACCGGVR